MPELIELIRHCQIFISADTGPLHIANALKRPLIAMLVLRLQANWSLWR